MKKVFGKYFRFLLLGVFALNLKPVAALNCDFVSGKFSEILIGKDSGIIISRPFWLEEQPAEEEESKSESNLWKPVLITVAAGGVIFLIYSLRTR